MPSLILGVAELFVDETPGGIVRWSIDLFGASQKTLLVVGIVAVSLALGALFGVLTRRSFATGAAGFVAFGVVGAWATGRGASTRPAGPGSRRPCLRARASRRSGCSPNPRRGHQKTRLCGRSSRSACPTAGDSSSPRARSRRWARWRARQVARCVSRAASKAHGPKSRRCSMRPCPRSRRLSPRSTPPSTASPRS